MQNKQTVTVMSEEYIIFKTLENAPETSERPPETSERHPETPERHPEIPERHPKTSERHPEISEHHPKIPERHPETFRRVRKNQRLYPGYFASRNKVSSLRDRQSKSLQGDTFISCLFHFLMKENFCTFAN
jgi:hypothetical protein